MPRKPGGPKNTAILTLTPSTISSGETYSISGEGFTPGRFIALGILEPDVAWYWNGYVDNAGKFSFEWVASDPGAMVVHNAYQKKGTNAGYDLLATAILMVTA